MKTHIEQHIWTLLEDLGYNPENDSESYNKADKVICNICDLFKRTQPDKNEMITKKQVLEALELIEKYKTQEFVSVEQIEQKIIEATDKRSILVLGLKTRENNCLISMGVNTVGELLTVGRFDLTKCRNLGPKGIVMINKALKDDGIETEDFLQRDW